MVHLAVAALAATAAVLPQSRTFWKPIQGAGLQPGQVEVTAHLVGEGAAIAVYQEQGYTFSRLGRADEEEQVANLVRIFDEVVYPRETALFGPCPDVDGDGKVVVLLCDLDGEDDLFWWFDQLTEAEAQQHGLHSNRAEILYHRFEQQGNRRIWNLRRVAETFHRLLHYVNDPLETSWSRLIAAYTPYLCDLANARSLWGDADPAGLLHRFNDPLGPGGWSPLFIEYLRDQFGDGLLRDLVGSRDLGLPALTSVLASRGVGRTALDTLADMAMACWLDDRGLEEGRFSFSRVAPRRPVPAVRVPASRPGAGYVKVGAGGMTHIVVDGTGDKPLPLTLQGEPGIDWIGRAVLLRRSGPDEELALSFDEGGVARLELPGLARGEVAVLAAVPRPEGGGLVDYRMLTLQWGLGWVPQPHERTAGAAYEPIVQAALPDGGRAARSRLGATVERLIGEPGDGPPIRTRYAWAPESGAVVDLLREAAERRGLPVTVQSFSQPGPAGVQQLWSNVLIELPGTDPRRWPVVVAAHWDGARPELDDSYYRALNLDDNASGTAVALEIAAVVSRYEHRAPVLIALLDGGYHDAAGARALLAHLEGRVAVWIELDGVAFPGEGEEPTVRLEGGERLAQVPTTVSRALRSAGLRARRSPVIESPHTGAGQAHGRGIPALVVRTRTAAETAGQLGMPPEVERLYAAPELAILITKALSAGVLQLAGGR